MEVTDKTAAAPSKVLVVDDEEDLETIIRQRFRKEIRGGKYEFLFARDGIQALEMIRGETEPPLILTDINMPRMDGLTLLAEVSSIDPIQRVVIVSAYGDMENIRSAMNRGAFDFLTKPIDLSDLEVTIDRTIDHIRKQQDALRKQEELRSLHLELDLARKLQETIIPVRVPAVSGFEIEALYVPMSRVGGDFYDFVTADDGGLGVLVADVVGHGVPAAMIAAMTKIAFFQQKEHIRDPLTVLTGMDGQLLETGATRNNFLTAAYVYIDPQESVLYTANAGHPPVLISRAKDRQLHRLRPRGTVLGLFADHQPEFEQMPVEAGDRIVLYTDGVFECPNENQDWYGEDRFFELIESFNGSPPGELLKQLHQELSDWAGKSADGFEDDVTAVVIDVH